MMASLGLTSSLSSSNASFVTATLKSGMNSPVTPPAFSRRCSGTGPNIVHEREDHPGHGVEGLDELAGIASAMLTLSDDLKYPGGADLIPQITLDTQDFLLSSQQPLSTAAPTLPIPDLLLPESPWTPSEGGNIELELSEKPFQKWMKSLHRRANNRSRRLRGSHVGRSRDGFNEDDPYSLLPDRIHTKSSSGSSFAFVSAVKSASIGLASISTRTKSRLGTRHSRDRSRTDRSSRLSVPPPRFSEDSATNSELVPPVDPAAVRRSLQRRSILEELITTEEGYIGDIRFLMNVSLGTGLSRSAEDFHADRSLGIHLDSCVVPLGISWAAVIDQSEPDGDCAASRRDTRRAPPSCPRLGVYSVGCPKTSQEGVETPTSPLEEPGLGPGKCRTYLVVAAGSGDGGGLSGCRGGGKDIWEKGKIVPDTPIVTLD